MSKELRKSSRLLFDYDKNYPRKAERNGRKVLIVSTHFRGVSKYAFCYISLSGSNQYHVTGIKKNALRRMLSYETNLSFDPLAWMV